jgi:non-ribosomal peptide synthetase component F
MQATPSTWQMMIDSDWQKAYAIKILSGGEALKKELADQLLKRCTALWNMYGPTETTIWSTIKKVSPGDQQLSIGHPINQTDIYIMDELGRPLPSGMPGELYIGGDGVADGYLNRPELTSEKFIQGDDSGQILYKTGDLGKLLENGEYLRKELNKPSFWQEKMRLQISG